MVKTRKSPIKSTPKQEWEKDMLLLSFWFTTQENKLVLFNIILVSLRSKSESQVHVNYSLHRDEHQ